MTTTTVYFGIPTWEAKWSQWSRYQGKYEVVPSSFDLFAIFLRHAPNLRLFQEETFGRFSVLTGEAVSLHSHGREFDLCDCRLVTPLSSSIVFSQDTDCFLPTVSPSSSSKKVSLSFEPVLSSLHSILTLYSDLLSYVITTQNERSLEKILDVVFLKVICDRFIRSRLL